MLRQEDASVAKTDSEIAVFAMIKESTELLKDDPNLIYVEATGEFMQRYLSYDPEIWMVEVAKKIYRKLSKGNIKLWNSLMKP